MSLRKILALFLFGQVVGCQEESRLADLQGPASQDLAASGDLPPRGDLPAAGDPQTPPTVGGAQLTAWLQAGYYKSWHCEPAQHPAGPNGAHGANRICTNQVLATAATATEYPVGAASVKELYSGANIVGYAVSERIQPGPSGSSWYWNENGSGGVGILGCTGCHGQAGSGGTFTGQDFVFVRVM